MRRRSQARSMAAAFMLLVLALPAGAFAAPPERPGAPPPVSDHVVGVPTTAGYVVALRSGVALDQVGAVRRGTVRPGKTFTAALRGFTARLTPGAAAALRADPAVDAVEYDSLMYPAGAQAWPTWGLDRIDQPNRARNHTYAYSSSGAGVNAYIVDSGVQPHRDFGSRLARGFSADGRSGRHDCAGHGTHVAGTVGGRKFGVAKRVRLIPVRVGGCGTAVRRSDLLAGLDYIVRHHTAGQPAVANVSLGGPPSRTVDRAVRRVLSEGVSVVAAAGNAGVNACNWSPGRVGGVITVGAVNHRNYAPDWSNHGPCVDLFAPGVDIKSTGIASRTARKVASGTSMAAPHVAGVVARHLARQPNASPSALHRHVVRSAKRGVARNAGANTTRRMLYVKGSVPTRLLAANGDLAASWGSRITVGATLYNMATDRPIGGQRVALFRRSAGSGTWRRVTSETTNRYGQARINQRAERPADYQLRHLGSATSKPSNARAFSVEVHRAYTELSVSVSDTEVAPGQEVTITAVLMRVSDGKRLAGRRVELYDQYSAVPPSATTDESGTVHFKQRPVTDTYYYLLHPQDARTYESNGAAQVNVTGAS